MSKQREAEKQDAGRVWATGREGPKGPIFSSPLPAHCLVWSS